MGNSNSNSNSNSNTDNDKTKLKPQDINQMMDYIATHYILTLDFKSLNKMYQKEYCDKLVLVTSEIIAKNFTDMEITYLEQRTKNNEIIDELTKDKFIFFNKDKLDDLDIQSSIKKKRVCIGIAKFYIKIAHIFAAIVTTINPEYVYKDNDGNTIKASINEKKDIPANIPRTINKLNICDNRINSLKIKENKKEENKKEEEKNDNIFNKLNFFNKPEPDVTINPKVCSINNNNNKETKHLIEEPGIQELEQLYFDDNYDYTTGKFTAMSESTKNQYNEDLNIFYSIFTDNDDNDKKTPSKFGDIKLRDYGKNTRCNGDKPKLKEIITGKLSDNSIARYAENVKLMMQKTKKNQGELTKILNKLFVYSINPQTKKKQIRITPELTEDKLQELVVETREKIIKLYLTCEADYTEGIKIYEELIEEQIIKSTKEQMNNLINKQTELV